MRTHRHGGYLEMLNHRLVSSKEGDVYLSSTWNAGKGCSLWPCDLLLSVVWGLAESPRLLCSFIPGIPLPPHLEHSSQSIKPIIMRDVTYMLKQPK